MDEVKLGGKSPGELYGSFQPLSSVRIFRARAGACAIFFFLSLFTGSVGAGVLRDLPPRLLLASERSGSRNVLSFDNRFLASAVVGEGDADSGIRTSGPSLMGFAASSNSPIRTEDLDFIRDLKQNISAIRTSGPAFMARIFPSGSTTAQEPFFDSDVASFNESSHLANYVVWGDASSGGEIDGATEEEKHFIDLHDACGVKNAFIGMANGELRCIGDVSSCTGYDTLAELSPWISKKKVFCARTAPMAVVELSSVYPDDTGNLLHVIGNSVYGLPDESNSAHNEFYATWKNVQPGDLRSVAATDDAAAIMLAGGRVLSWRNQTPFLPSDNREINFGVKLVSNSIGFAVLMNTGKVTTWGPKLDLDFVPEAIRDVGADTVVDIHAFGECFLAITIEGAVRTWGLGEYSYCRESGAFGSPGFTSYHDIKDEVTRDVVQLCGNEKALVATKTNGDVVTWGHEMYGGSKVPPESLEDDWVAEEIKWAVPDTYGASNAAFAWKRQDGKVVVWGNTYTSAVWLGLSEGAKQIVGSNETFVLLTERDNLVVWPGDLQGIYTANPSEVNANFELQSVPKRLLASPHGIAVVLGHDCLYDEWSGWSACSEECGGGVRQRNRSVKEYASNGVCDFSVKETEACNVKACEEETDDPAPAVSSGFLWAMGGAGAALFLCLGGGIYVCARRRQSEDDTYL